MPKKETVCAEGSRPGRVEVPRPSEPQMIPPGAQDAGDGAVGFGIFSAGC